MSCLSGNISPRLAASQLNFDPASFEDCASLNSHHGSTTNYAFFINDIVRHQDIWDVWAVWVLEDQAQGNVELSENTDERTGCRVFA